MKYFDLYASYPDYTIAAAWDSQVKEAETTPWLADTLRHCGDELFARFAACYAELRALPRGARRSLQRRLAGSSEMATVFPKALGGRGQQLQHRMAWSLAGAALLLALGQEPVTAATITVTTSNPNIAADGQCSLIEAIKNANNDAATHADCPAGSGADTIVLLASANVILSVINNNDLGATGLPVITSRIVIEGNGAIIARQANAPAFRLMAVTNPGDLTLQNVTLSGGSSSGDGGGVLSAGVLRIKSSTISGNLADNGGGIFNLAYLAVENSTISSNTADIGGGIFNSGYQTFSAQVTISNSTISGNSATTAGGLRNSAACDFYCGGYLTLNNSLIAGNEAAVAREIDNFAALRNVWANNFNLFGSNGDAGVSGFIPGPTDIVPAAGVHIANILGPLKNNGGPTRTHALKPGSPALDAVPLLAPGCTSTDQRGIARPQGAACDIGAFEGSALGSISVSDFDGDGATDVGIYRDGAWWIVSSSDGGVVNFGWGGLLQDTLVHGDYDGDGKADPAVYRDGVWWVLQSSNGVAKATQWGGLPQDKPVPGDYDGDGKADAAVYRDGVWWVLQSSTGVAQATQWGGLPQDKLVPGDYDGDGKADVAVYRGGNWFIRRSTDSGMIYIGWGGAAEDIPVPADYDGDGITDAAVYRGGNWFIRRSTDGGMTYIAWGGAVEDTPVPADYDGDGKTDIAVYRDGVWFIRRSSDTGMTVMSWGTAGDTPIN